MVGSTKTASATGDGYLRKIRKPLVEKKRRDRMNRGIEQLKMLIADSMSEVNSSKLDKADILDMTVKHIQSLKNQQASASMATEASTYGNGFKECAKETIRYLSSTRAITPQSLGQLSSHLHSVYTKKSETIPTSLVSTSSRASSPAVQTLPPQFCSTPVQRLNNMLNCYSTKYVSRDSSEYGQLSGSVCSVMDVSHMSHSMSDMSSGGSDMYKCVTDMSAGSSLGLSSSDLVLDNIIKEEKPWRPW